LTKLVIRQRAFVKHEGSKIAQGCVIVGRRPNGLLLAQRISANARFWHKADMPFTVSNVRFWRQRGNLHGGSSNHSTGLSDVIHCNHPRLPPSDQVVECVNVRRKAEGNPTNGAPENNSITHLHSPN